MIVSGTNSNPDQRVTRDQSYVANMHMKISKSRNNILSTGLLIVLVALLANCAASPKFEKKVAVTIEPFATALSVPNRILVPARYLGTNTDRTEPISTFAQDALIKEAKRVGIETSGSKNCRLTGTILQFDRNFKGNGRSDITYGIEFQVRSGKQIMSVRAGYTHRNTEKDRDDPEYAESLAELVRHAAREKLLQGKAGDFIRSKCSVA